MHDKYLILGNGFDIAHGMPTRYSDFLDFGEMLLKLFECKDIDSMFSAIKEIDDIAMYNKFYSYIRRLDIVRNGNVDTIKANNFLRINDYLLNNVWFYYLSRIRKEELIPGPNWVDFEREISHSIKLIDQLHRSMDQRFSSLFEDYSNSDNKTTKNDIFFEICEYYVASELRKDISIMSFREELYEALEKLMNAFDYYLTEFIKNMKIEPLEIIKEISPDRVISFNYTNTYERVYPYDNTDICHVHGMCGESDLTKKHNIVLGIENYTPKNSDIENVDFSIFKKSIQRIRRRTDIDYINWVNAIDTDYKKVQETNNMTLDRIVFKKKELWIYGHSLDITDKDILYRYLNSKAFNVHIYAYNKTEEGKLISNLMRIIGEDDVVSRFHDGSISFWENNHVAATKSALTV